MKRVGAVGNDHTPAPVCEGVGAGLGDDVPVLGPNVVAEHVADFHGIEASDACQFRDGVQHFFGLKLGFHGTGGVVHLGGDGAAGVDESNPWQVGPRYRRVEFGGGSVGFMGAFFPGFDVVDGVGNVVAVVEFDGQVPFCCGGSTRPTCSTVSLCVSTVTLMRAPGSGTFTMDENGWTRSMNESLH